MSSKVYLLGTGRYGHKRTKDGDSVISERHRQERVIRQEIGLQSSSSNASIGILGTSLNFFGPQLPHRHIQVGDQVLSLCRILSGILSAPVRQWALARSSCSHLFLICPNSPGCCGGGSWLPCRFSNYCEYVGVCVPPQDDSQPRSRCPAMLKSQDQLHRRG